MASPIVMRMPGPPIICPVCRCIGLRSANSKGGDIIAVCRVQGHPFYWKSL